MKQSMLLEFKELHKDLPAQRSEEWLNGRKLTIGGSELSKLSSPNNRRALIEERLGIKKRFDGNTATRWGTVLEALSTIYLSKLFNVEILEFGSIPSDVKSFKYSPDGLACFPDDKIKLIEIKNPFSRVPNGKIPASYKPQVYGGLDAVPLADSLLYCDFLVKRCSLSELTNAVNSAADSLPVVELTAAYVGLIYTCEETGWLDYGECDIDTLDEMLEYIINKSHVIHYAEYDSLAFSREYLSKGEWKEAGILPLKLIKCDIVEIDRTTWRKEKKYAKSSALRFIDTLEPHMNEVIETIETLLPLSSEEQVARLNAMFTKECQVLPTLTPEELSIMMG